MRLEIREPALREEDRLQVTTTHIKTNRPCKQRGCAFPHVTIRARNGAAYTVCSQHGRALLEWVRARNESAGMSKWHNDIDRMMRRRWEDNLAVEAPAKPGSFGAQVTRRRMRNSEAKTAGGDGKLYPARLVSKQRDRLIQITHGLHHRRGLSVRGIAATIKAETGLSRSVGTIYSWLQTPCDECEASADAGQPEHQISVMSTTPTVLAVAA
jgi:hypothetical protein